MSNVMLSQFAVSDHQIFDFKKPQNHSDSEEEEQQQQKLLLQSNKDSKKIKKVLDIEAIKQELNVRPTVDAENTPQANKRLSRIINKSLPNLLIPTSPVLIEQLANVKAIKQIKQQVPPEIMNKFYSELRYLYVPANTTVYRQGDQQKRYYIILEGKCVVMKPKEKMVGSKKYADEKSGSQREIPKKIDQDPYGLKSTFPDYLILKVLFNGDAFGEAAIKLDIARSSTVFALENTHLIYLSESAYVQLLDTFLSKALDDKIQFFTHHPTFSSCHIELTEIMGILIECHLQTYKAGEILYEEKTNANHIYFIVNGQVELSKQAQSKNLILSSYGENQIFGEVEILNKIQRYTKARVLSPRLTVYKIRKQKFFDNLGNIQVYENLKNQSKIILQHWTMIYNSAVLQLKPKDEIFQAAQDQITNRKNSTYKTIVNKKVVEVQGEKLNQVKVIQHLSDTIIKDNNYVASSPNKVILQRVYSNALQQYQARLLKKPQQTQSNDDKCVRSNAERSFCTERQSPVRKSSLLHFKLPTMQSNASSLSLPKSNLNQVFDSISRLPRVPRDNLVLSLMYQQAFKSDNPDKKAKQIQQVIQASFRNVRKQYEPKERVSTIPKHKTTDSLFKSLKLTELSEESRLKENYVNFVHSKQIN